MVFVSLWCSTLITRRHGGKFWKPGNVDLDLAQIPNHHTGRIFVPADSSTDITMRPRPKEEEVRFILEAISDYLTVEVCAACLCCALAICACSLPCHYMSAAPAQLRHSGVLRNGHCCLLIIVQLCNAWLCCTYACVPC